MTAYEERIFNIQKEKTTFEQKLDDAKQEGRQKGIKIDEKKGREGREAEKIEVAENLLKAGISIEKLQFFLLMRSNGYRQKRPRSFPRFTALTHRLYL